METKYIPEFLRIYNDEFVNEKAVKRGYLKIDESAVKEIKNTPISGIVVTKLDSFGAAKVYDPRGFTCTVTNLNELLDKVDIERGVISQDLCYGKAYRSNSWRLYTSDMIKKESLNLTSVSELKIGWLYMVYGRTTLLYLGKLKWKDEYGTLRLHHTFARPETREVFAYHYLTASGITSMEIDDPDTYKEALDAFNSSWQGNKDIKVTEVLLNPEIRYKKFGNLEKSLFPTDTPEITQWGYVHHAGPELLFVRQIDKQSIEVLTAVGMFEEGRDAYYYRTGKYYKKICINNYCVKQPDSKQLPKVESIGPRGKYYYDYNDGIDKLKELLASGPEWSFIDVTDRRNLKYISGHYEYYGFTARSGSNEFFICTLSNGEVVLESELGKQHLKY